MKPIPKLSRMMRPSNPERMALSKTFLLECHFKAFFEHFQRINLKWIKLFSAGVLTLINVSL